MTITNKETGEAPRLKILYNNNSYDINTAFSEPSNNETGCYDHGKENLSYFADGQTSLIVHYNHTK